jgi:hypothetical protein
VPVNVNSKYRNILLKPCIKCFINQVLTNTSKINYYIKIYMTLNAVMKHTVIPDIHEPLWPVNDLWLPLQSQFKQQKQSLYWLPVCSNIQYEFPQWCEFSWRLWRLWNLFELADIILYVPVTCQVSECKGITSWFTHQHYN